MFVLRGVESVSYTHLDVYKRQLLKPLAARGYEGWLVVEAEQDPAKAPPLEYATKGYLSLLATAEAAGFTVLTREDG